MYITYLYLTKIALALILCKIFGYNGSLSQLSNSESHIPSELRAVSILFNIVTCMLPWNIHKEIAN